MSVLSTSHNLVRSSEYRFTRVTTDDHSATIWIVSVLSLIYVVLALAVRLGYTKWRAHALDDIVVTFAHVCSQIPINYSFNVVQLTRK